MSFHLLAFSESSAAGTADDAINAVADPEFSQRNNRFITSEKFNAISFFANGASITRARLNWPRINAYGRHQIWPVERSATIPDFPRWQDLRDYPLEIPINEELGVEVTNDLAMGTEIENVFMWIATPAWNRNLIRGVQRLTLRATAAVAGTAQAWSVLGAITMAENIRGGWYALVGSEIFDAGTLAFRWVFTRPMMYLGRKLRPGGICMEAIGNSPLLGQTGGLGIWGYFHSFELPQLEILANATGASTQEIRMDVVYLGENFNPPTNIA